MYRRDHGGSGDSSLLSFLTGAIIGAGIALLYAPKSGKETREILTDYKTNIHDRATSLPDDLLGSKENIINRGKNMIERGKDMIKQGSDLVNGSKGYIDEKKRNLSDAIEAGRAAMEQEKNELNKSLEVDE